MGVGAETGKPVLAGCMQSWPLTLDRLIDHAARWHGHREIVSFDNANRASRATYREAHAMAARLSNALASFGIRQGDRVATMAMNHLGHFAAWYGISGMGAVCHTLNPRMNLAQLIGVASHAGDRVLLCDADFADAGRQLVDAVDSLEHLFLFDGAGTDGSAGDTVADLLRDQPDSYPWGQFDEQSAAGLCYTSGTTGDPKGVLYSHRSNMLHAFMVAQADGVGLDCGTVFMPVVPMFHANAWGAIYAAPMLGMKLVLPGRNLDGESVCRKIQQEGVTCAASVPTAWLGLLDFLDASGEEIPSLKKAGIGGSAASERLVERLEERGIEARHAWGMTETSPLGTSCAPVPEMTSMAPAERRQYSLKQGRVPFGVDMRIVDDDGAALPHDGVTPGHLQVRGPAVAAGYYRAEQQAVTADGFLDTGDIGTIDELGYLKITDRAKDMIKSGGEWISSIDVENAVCTVPGVAMAAVIGVPHVKWDERPLLLIVEAEGQSVDEDAVRALLLERFPKWWLPDETVLLDTMPLGATGKIDKLELRRRYARQYAGSA